MLKNTDYVKEKLLWMEKEEIWPGGLRYLWTDAFGVILLVSLYRETDEERYLRDAKELVAEVDRVLGRKKGYRIGEAEERHGQYFHYLAMWAYALYTLGLYETEYQEKAIQLILDIHPHFIEPEMGVYWKMKEDLSEPEPGYGFGALDHFHGYVVYSLIAPYKLEDQIRQLKAIMSDSYESLDINQDLGLGMMLWFTQFYPGEPWAEHQRRASLQALDDLWVDPPGYFCRQRGVQDTKFAFTNYGISVGLQAIGEQPDRVDRLNSFFRGFRSGDEYERDAITHVMECCSHFPGLLIKNYDRALLLQE